MVLIAMHFLWASAQVGDDTGIAGSVQAKLDWLFASDFSSGLDDTPPGSGTGGGGGGGAGNGNGTGGSGNGGGQSNNTDPLADPTVVAALDTAWTESNPGTGTDPNRAEQGGWIVRNPDGTFTIQRWPAGQAAGITPTAAPSNVAGSFHTHPNLGGNWQASPSTADLNWVAADPANRAPHYVVSDTTIYVINADGTVDTVTR